MLYRSSGGIKKEEKCPTNNEQIIDLIDRIVSNNNIIYNRINYSIKHEGIYTMQEDSFYFNDESSDYEDDEAAIQQLNEAFFIPTPRATQRKTDKAPVCIAKVHSIGGIRTDRPLIALLDLGSTSTTLIQYRSLPPGCKPRVSECKTITTTANGDFDTSMVTSLQQIQLPEFINGRAVNGVSNARLFDSPNCQYDIIFGRDFLQKAGL